MKVPERWMTVYRGEGRLWRKTDTTFLESFMINKICKYNPVYI